MPTENFSLALAKLGSAKLEIDLIYMHPKSYTLITNSIPWCHRQISNPLEIVAGATCKHTFIIYVPRYFF